MPCCLQKWKVSSLWWAEVEKITFEYSLKLMLSCTNGGEIVLFEMSGRLNGWFLDWKRSRLWTVLPINKTVDEVFVLWSYCKWSFKAMIFMTGNLLHQPQRYFNNKLKIQWLWRIIDIDNIDLWCLVVTSGAAGFDCWEHLFVFICLFIWLGQRTASQMSQS